MGIRESPFRLIDLQTRQSQIHEHGVHLIDSLIIKHLREIVECGMHRYEAIGKAFHLHSLRGKRKRLSVSVDANQASMRARFKECRGMPGQAKRAIHGDRPRIRQCRRHQIHAVTQQHWLMNRCHICHQNSTAGNTSSAISEYPCSLSARYSSHACLFQISARVPTPITTMSLPKFA